MSARMASAQTKFEFDRSFYVALTGQDEIGVVIRAHIYIEQLVNEALERLIPYPDPMEAMRLDYSQRVHLLVALGLKEQHLSPLLALGRLRNKFAHKLDAGLTEGVVNDFFRTFDGENRQIIQNAYSSARDKLSSEPRPNRASDLPPKDRFALYAATLHSALIAAIAELEKQISGAA